MKINNKQFLQGLILQPLRTRINSILALSLSELKKFTIFLATREFDIESPEDRIYQYCIMFLADQMNDKEYIEFYERHLE